VRWVLFLVSAALGLGLDLGSKSWAFEHPALKPPKPYGSHLSVIPGWFDIALSENPGAAWGLLYGRHTFFIVISIAAFLAITYFVQTAPKHARLTPVILGLVFAGVAGNFYDRCAGGVVRDFLDAHTPDAGMVHDLVEKLFGRTHWPTFNVADIFICVGAGATVLVFWREERKTRKSGAGSPAIAAATPAALPASDAPPLPTPPASEAPSPGSAS
jgi:signal peptidase II